VLEIGPGLGYTVVYADRLGIKDYTVVDLPMTNVAQAYFIGRSVGEERIVLEGEPGQDRDDVIKIRTPTVLREQQRQFDLIIERFPFWLRNGYAEEIIRAPREQG